MDRHTYLGKSLLGSTQICDFTDYQGIGRDPLYRRWDSVSRLLSHAVAPEYVHFLAAPDYSEQLDQINWYVPNWSEPPQPLTSLPPAQQEHYLQILNQTLEHYHQALDTLTGEDLQIMACVLRYVDEDFVYCADQKVHLLAWGMKPDTRKHQVSGTLVHLSPTLVRHTLTFDPGAHGTLATSLDSRIALSQGTKLDSSRMPRVIPEKGWQLSGWSPDPNGIKVDRDLQFTALYTPALCRITFLPGPHGQIQDENAEITVPAGTMIAAESLPQVMADDGYQFSHWSPSAESTTIQEDTTFTAQYDETPPAFPPPPPLMPPPFGPPPPPPPPLPPKLPWYRRLWNWFMSLGWLRWLLLLLLLLILSGILSWFLLDCRGCVRRTNGVIPLETFITPEGDTIDDNGTLVPITIGDDGKLPEGDAVAAPVLDSDHSMPPVHREPGVPPVIANRLILFLENDGGDVDALAADFKKAYPGNEYSVVGYDREVKSVVIQIPEDERDQIRSGINSRLPRQPFIVLDEQLIELNGVPSTSNAPHGWHLKAVKAQQGWEITRGSPSVVVAVIDDGIEASHPMFAGRIVNAYNVYTQNNRLSKGEGHGTHTAGLAVGSTKFLDKGAAGIAPECMLMPVQVFDNSAAPISAVVSGVMYAIHHGADVVNISLGPSFQGLNQLPPEQQAQLASTSFRNLEKLWERVCRLAAAKKTVLVFSAGNDDILSCIPPENRNNSSIVIGAVDQQLNPTAFTNYGIGTDLSAPGSGIYSSFPVGSFQSYDGTSMAAPIVAGTVALMKSIKKDISVEQARNVLQRTGIPVHGNLPPMIQIPEALHGVKAGDFSAPSSLSLPSPNADLDLGDYVAVVEEIVADTSPAEPVDSRTRPVAAVQAPRSPRSASGYDDTSEIRRLIELYRAKIRELEAQLPDSIR